MSGNNANYHIYLVEDEKDVRQLVKNAFEAEGFAVVGFSDGLPLLRYVSEHGLPHLAIIDLRLPSMHGFEVSARLRESGDVPIIFISSDDDLETKVEGITRYAEDYVVKPFETRELIARVRRVLSRFPDWNYAQMPVVRIDSHLSVDFGNMRLLIGDRSVPLTPIEANLLSVLLRNRGRTVSSSALISRVWQLDANYEEALRVHMHRLRRKIEPDLHSPRYIQTERGVGYRFVE